MSAHCRRCNVTHTRPVGRKCKLPLVPLIDQHSGHTSYGLPPPTPPPSVLGNSIYTPSWLNSHARMYSGANTVPTYTGGRHYAGLSAAGSHVSGHEGNSARSPKSSTSSDQGLDLDAIREAIKTAVSDAVDPLREDLATVKYRLDNVETRGTPKAAKKTKTAPKKQAETDKLNEAFKKIGLADDASTEDDDASTTDDTSSTDSDSTPKKKKDKRKAKDKKKAKKAAKKKKDEEEESARKKEEKKDDTDGGKDTVIEKSGRDMLAHNCSKAVVAWPHHEIYKGAKMLGAENDTLTIQEFIHGFHARAVTKKFGHDKEFMYDYLKDLMEDAMYHEWYEIRSFHSLFLTKIERGENSWDDKEGIARLKSRHMYRNKSKQNEKNAYSAPADPTAVPCTPFQRGECRIEGDHRRVQHICAHCLKTRNRAHKHPENS